MGREEIKYWRCENGHVMGIVARNGSGRRQMLLLREALEGAEAGVKTEVDVMAVVEGRVMDVRCSVCGAVRTWFEEARR